MNTDHQRRRVLVLADEAARQPLLEVLGYDLVEEWETVPTDDLTKARFVLQHDPCDVLLVDESRLGDEDGVSLFWLAVQRRAPVVLLADAAPELVAEALEHGVQQWLPRDVALRHPGLLGAVLNQAAQVGDLRRRARLTGEALQECRRQVNRLVGMLWEASPVEPRTRWFTQRHMLERLEEEIARAERHGSPLSVVLGEIEVDSLEEQQRAIQQLNGWTADRICRAKRRSDVVGQYGPNGFMLLLGNTPERGAATCCRRLQTVLQAADSPGRGLRGPIHVHFGIAAHSPAVSTTQALLGRAEERLGETKTERLVAVEV